LFRNAVTVGWRPFVLCCPKGHLFGAQSPKRPTPLWDSRRELGFETRILFLVHGLVVVLVLVVLLEFEDECEDDDEHDVPGYQGSDPLVS